MLSLWAERESSGGASGNTNEHVQWTTQPITKLENVLLMRLASNFHLNEWVSYWRLVSSSRYTSVKEMQKLANVFWNHGNILPVRRVCHARLGLSFMLFH